MNRWKYLDVFGNGIDSNLRGCDSHLINLYDIARGKAGVPFMPISGLRTPEHNKKIGGAADSAHLKGLAADMAVTNWHDAFCIIKALMDCGVTRIGLNLNTKGELRGIHSDIDPDKFQQVLWVKQYKR
jgi:hypothetical protein